MHTQMHTAMDTLTSSHFLLCETAVLDCSAVAVDYSPHLLLQSSCELFSEAAHMLL